MAPENRKQHASVKLVVMVVIIINSRVANTKHRSSQRENRLSCGEETYQCGDQGLDATQSQEPRSV